MCVCVCLCVCVLAACKLYLVVFVSLNTLIGREAPDKLAIVTSIQRESYGIMYGLKC